jgi:hypothetical protein
LSMNRDSGDAGVSLTAEETSSRNFSLQEKSLCPDTNDEMRPTRVEAVTFIDRSTVLSSASPEYQKNSGVPKSLRV